MSTDDGLIRFHCHQCGKKLKSQASQAGRPFACPKCGSALSVPFAGDDKTMFIGAMAADDVMQSEAPPTSLGPQVEACPHCAQLVEIRRKWVGQVRRCPVCGGDMDLPPNPAIPQISIASPIASPAMPTALPAPDWPTTEASVQPLRARAPDRSPIKLLMLICTIGWAMLLAGTFLFMIFAGATDPEMGNPERSDAYRGGIIVGSLLGFLCLAFFETGAYAVVMVILWVAHIATKD